MRLPKCKATIINKYTVCEKNILINKVIITVSFVQNIIYFDQYRIFLPDKQVHVGQCKRFENTSN